MSPQLRVAACHVSPVLLNARATTEKCISLIHQAARAKANLIVFPETFIPAFPIWNAVRAPTENHELFSLMVQQSIYADGEEIDAIQEAARTTRTIISVGISEKVRYSSATLFNSNLIIGPEGDTMVHHRKLVPTFFEKLTWSSGDGYGLRVADTKLGKIGALICGENTNPLARYAMMAMGEQVHISCWPAIWPTRHTAPGAATTKDGMNTASANYDNVTANRVRTAAHCFEAKCFGVSCAAYLSNENQNDLARLSGASSGWVDELQHTSRAATMFVHPTGTPHPSFIIDDDGSGVTTVKDLLQSEEDLLYADMDLDDCVEGKQYHDVVGGYQRLDVFDLRIDKRRREPATVVE